MTEAELYDYLQATFGIGDWDEHISDVPWWKFRGTEIAKLKSMMKRRGATVQQLVTAAQYAVRIRKPIRATYQLFELIPDAMREKRQRERRLDTTDFDAAVAEAVEAGEHEWADRLVRSSGSETQRVIDQWRNRK